MNGQENGNGHGPHEEKWPEFLARVPNATCSSWWIDERKAGSPRFCRIAFPPEHRGLELECWYTDLHYAPNLTPEQRATMRAQELALREAHRAGEEVVIDMRRADEERNREQ